MRRALRDFTEKARDADIAVIYYAGHGIEVDGTNYLVPIDAVLERDTRLRGARQMLCLCQSFILRIAALWGSLPPCRFAGKRPVIQFLTTS
jgi:Caspase domain